MKEKTGSIVFVYSKEDAINFSKEYARVVKNPLFILLDNSEADFFKKLKFNFVEFEKFTNDKTFKNYSM